MVRPDPENARDKDVDKLWKSGVNPVEIKLVTLPESWPQPPARAIRSAVFQEKSRSEERLFQR